LTLIPSKRARRIIGRATTSAVEEGMAEYGPLAVGIVVIGLASVVVFTLAGVAYFAFGASPPLALGGATSVVGGSSMIARFLRSKSRRR
jgi:hypothetical protein